MSPQQYAEVQQLFEQIDDEIQRGELSIAKIDDRVCQLTGDVELRSRVQSMLRHHDPAAARAEGETIGVSVKNDVARPRSSNHLISPPETKSSRPSVPRDLLAADARRRFRLTGTWLYLLFLVPTAMVGFWTYHQIRDQLRSLVANELDGVSSGVKLSADGYLHDKARLVSSWSRTPDLRDAVATLASLPTDDASRWSDHPSAKIVADELRSLSGTPRVDFVIWNRSMVAIAAGETSSTKIGSPVQPSDAVSITRAMTGQTVLYGPQRVDKPNPTQNAAPIDASETQPASAPEPAEPVIGIFTPIFDDNDRVVATMLVRGLGWFEQLSGLFSRTTMATKMDAYLVNREGIMLTPSMVARTAALEGRLDYPPDAIAASMRVVDPGTDRLRPDRPIDRDTRPITLAVADLRKPPYGVRIQPYVNYAGRRVVGASQILNDWDLGVIVESPVTDAFAALRMVRTSYLLLATLLLALSLYAAWRIARRAARDSAAVHPLARYDVVDRLGSGGMGSVFLVRHRVLGRETALKVLPIDSAGGEDLRRFDREAKLAASLTNPHTVTIYDYGRSPEGNAYCAMEYLRGLTLAEVVARDGPLPIGRVLTIVRQICDAMVDAHDRGLCHRDLKPHNIMLSMDRTVGDWVVVFDYGLAKPLRPDTKMYQTTQMVWSGTPMYMAPERFRQPGGLDARSDVYSVGAIAYFLIAGHPPFLETSPEALFASILSEPPVDLSVARGTPVPAEIQRLVNRLMAKSVEDRIATMADASRVIDDLRTRYPWSFDESLTWWKIHG